MSKKKQKEETGMAEFDDIKKGSNYENNNLFYTIIVVLVFGTGIFVGDYIGGRYDPDGSDVVPPIKVDEVEAVKKLDINDTLVRSLYNKVTVTGNKTCGYNSFDWNYKKDKDFIVEDATTEEKLTVAVSNLNDESLKSINKTDLANKGVDTKIVIEGENADFNREYVVENEAKYYDKNLIESLYKGLYGTNSILDTSKYIYRSENILKYAKEIDGYVVYNAVGRGTCSDEETYSREITEAKKVNDKIQIFETIKVTKNNETDEFIKYIYTFVKEDDSYIYESRVRA